ncbi:MAG: FAD-dependent oxidoreductase [Bacteroidota bacterium]
MKNVDYIIVGCGLAGIAFCEQLRKFNKSFKVFDNNSQRSSSVAAGLYNPVILKRFTPAWFAKEQLALAMPHYNELEQLLKVKLNYPISVRRKFTSIKEQNNWAVASDKPILSEFIHSEILKNNNPEIDAPFGFGKVLHSGRIHTKTLVERYRDYLRNQDLFSKERLSPNHLKVTETDIHYKGDLKAKYIIFTEGFGAKANPFFEDLPIVGLKGEMLIIKAPKLKLDFIIKSSVFVVPMGEDLYWVGATYNREDKTESISEEGKTQLISKLKTVVNCDFEVREQVAGIRPTTKDRRPLVGASLLHKNVYMLNGMGTRGVMIAPYIAKQLFDHIELAHSLDSEIDLSRFKAFR